MAYEIGTADDYLDALVRLKEFISDPTRAIQSAGTGISELDPIDINDVWEIKDWDTNFDGSGGIELIAAGPGVSGIDDILFGVRTYAYPGVGGYNWILNGYTGYSGASNWLTHPGSMGAAYSADNPAVLLNNQQMNYWYFANGRRICGVLKVGGTYYAQFYVGYLLPYGTPSAWPYPLVIGGCSYYSTTQADNVYSTSHASNRSYVDPYAYDVTYVGATLRYYNGGWISFGNWAGSTSLRERFVWPRIYNDVYAGGDEPYYLINTMDPDPDGDIAVFPLVLIRNDPKNVFGELQGVYCCPCDGVVAEDTVTIGGVTYIIFQNGNRNDSGDYVAYKKE